MFYLHHSAGWGWGWWILMALGMIVFWVALIYGVTWLLRSGRPAEDSGPSSAPEAPEETLKRRLAAGDLSLEEYERLLEAVQRPTTGSVPG